MLAVHSMLGKIMHTHRLECACADMQGKPCSFHATPIQSFEHFFIEMQPCRRSRHRTGGACINSLVAAFIGLNSLTPDVRRQGHFSVAFDQINEVCRKAQMKKLANAALYGDVKRSSQPQNRSCFWRAGSAYLRQCLMRPQWAFEQHLDRSAACLDPKKAGMEYASVIKYQQIIRADEFRQIGKMPVSQCLPHPQEAAGAPFGQWSLGNQMGRKRVIEVVDSKRHRVKSYRMLAVKGRIRG